MGLSACLLVLVCSVQCITVLCLRLSLQGCQSDGKDGWWGIASVKSAQMGEVTTSGWTFTISYSNAQQKKASHVSYTFSASGGTKLTFTKEDPKDTYVSCCSFFSTYVYYLLLHLLNVHVCPVVFQTEYALTVEV